MMARTRLAVLGAAAALLLNYLAPAGFLTAARAGSPPSLAAQPAQPHGGAIGPAITATDLADATNIASTTPTISVSVGEGDGLLGTYYPNQSWSGEPYLTRVDPTIDFPGGPTPPPGRSSDFSVVWSGLLLVETAGAYTFGLVSDDGSFLILNGSTVIDNGGPHPPQLAVNTVDLAAGLNSVSLMYFQAGGGAVMTFLWTPPDGTGLVVVPQGVLFSNSDGSLTGPPARLGFAAQPSGGKAGQTLTTQPVVRVQDANFQTVTTSAATVTISVSPGTGTAGAVLTCTGGLTEAAVSGVATFSGCAIDQPGSGYRLVATSPGLVSATGSSFDVIANGDGLLGTYYPNETWSGESSAITVDPVIDLNWGIYPYANPPASSDPDGGWSIEWTGRLLAVNPGTYFFGLISDDGSVLSLDGAVVVDNGGAHPPRRVDNTVELTAGFHSVLLRYFECCKGEALVHFFWIPPGGVGGVVPQAVLFSDATTATGTLLSDVAAGATSVTVNVTSACPFAATGGLTWQLRFSTPLTTAIAHIQAASAITAGQQTLQTSPVPYDHPAGETVTQVIADCGPPPNQPPIARLTMEVGPLSVSEDETLTLTVGEGTTFGGRIKEPISFDSVIRVSFSAGRSFDPDGDPLTYEWTIDGSSLPGGSNSAFTSDLRQGAHRVVLIVDDGRGGIGAAQGTIDITPRNGEFPFGPGARLVLGWPFVGTTGWGATGNVEGDCGTHCGDDWFAEDWNWSSGVGKGDQDRGKVLLSPADGQVLFAGEVSGGYGKQVGIWLFGLHDFAVRYTHMEEVWVSSGQILCDGTPVGLLGSTGTSSPHLHAAAYMGAFQTAQPHGVPGFNRLQSGLSLETISGNLTPKRPTRFAVDFVFQIPPAPPAPPFGCGAHFAVEGRVTNRGSFGVGGISLHLTGPITPMTTTSFGGDSGHFAYNDLVPGTYTITPSKAGCSFSPPSQTFTVISSHIELPEDFKATGQNCTR